MSCINHSTHRWLYLVDVTTFQAEPGSYRVYRYMSEDEVLPVHVDFIQKRLCKDCRTVMSYK